MRVRHEEDRTGRSSPDRIAHLFGQALELPRAEHTEFLLKACRGDGALVAELEALLEAHRTDPQADFALDIGKAGGLLEDANATASVGRTIGRYRLITEIGRGGMGTVFLAERISGGFEQRVALKVIRLGMDSEAILKRFLLERQILAGLEHPGIARLLDGGISDRGQPYFAMEYIDGVSITDYCDQNSLDVPTRIDLFIQACRAIQFAHTNLIVHRDVKPSNVLVSKRGEVKLVDFGIAKVLDPAGFAPETALTLDGIRPATPAYAAPEQLRGAAITTATDVYALGAVLYQLLSGHLPHDHLATSPEAAADEREATSPSPPSAAVDSDRKSNNQEHAVARGLSLERLRRHLVGDLDNITLKALAVEPERRYSSAEALAADLQRHVDGLPVNAQRASATYRARKFVRRHRVGILSASLVALSLVAGSGAALWQAVEKSREAARAVLEADKAQQLSTFLIDLFKSNDPQATDGADLRAADLLDRGVSRAAALDEQPAVKAAMLEAIGQMHEILGDYEKARTLLGESVSLHITAYGEEHRGTAMAQRRLASLHRDHFEPTDAAPLYERALKTLETLDGHESTGVATVLCDLGNLNRRLRDFTSALAVATECLRIRRELLGKQHPSVAGSLHNLAFTQHNTGDYESAEANYRQAANILRSDPSIPKFQLVRTLNNLGNVVNRLGHPDQALEIAEEVHEETLRLFGSEHLYTIWSLDNVARPLFLLGRYSSAEAHAREALELSHRIRGEDHYQSASQARHLADILRETGAVAESQLLYEASARNSKERADSERAATALSGLAMLFHDIERYDDAEQVTLESIALFKKTREPEHPWLADRRGALAGILRDKGELDKARATLEEVLPALEMASIGLDSVLAENQVRLGSVLLQQGQAEAAEPYLRAGWRTLTQARGSSNPQVGEAASWLGEALFQLGRSKEADQQLLESYRVLARFPGVGFRQEKAARSRVQRFLLANEEPDRWLEFERSLEPDGQ